MRRLRCASAQAWSGEAAEPAVGNLIRVRGKIENSWVNFTQGRTVSIPFLSMEDDEGNVYTNVTIFPTARYVRNGERFLSDGIFEISVDEIAEKVQEFVEEIDPNLNQQDKGNDWRAFVN